MRPTLAVGLSLGLGLGLVGTAFSAPAPRTPVQRQTLIDLAFVLGQAHALHRACAGKDDDTWRGRMSQMLSVETPDAAFKTRLFNSFNTGFLSPEAQAKDCPSAQAAERRVAAKGAVLASTLASPAP